MIGTHAKRNASLESEPNRFPGINHPIIPAAIAGRKTTEMILEKMLRLPYEQVRTFLCCLNRVFDRGTCHNLRDVFKPTLQRIIKKGALKALTEVIASIAKPYTWLPKLA